MSRLLNCVNSSFVRIGIGSSRAEWSSLWLLGVVVLIYCEMKITLEETLGNALVFFKSERSR